MYPVRSAHPVQEEQTVGVVDLVLQRHGLETIGDDLHPPAGQRELTCNDQTLTSGNVPGEVRDRHTALATALLASRTDDHGVAQDKSPVTRAGLGMTRDVDAEHPRGNTDLLGGQSDTTRRDQLGGKQVRDELDRGNVCWVNVAPRPGQHWIGGTDDPSNGACRQPGHHPSGGSMAHNRSSSIGERWTSTPSSLAAPFSSASRPTTDIPSGSCSSAIST